MTMINVHYFYNSALRENAPVKVLAFFLSNASQTRNCKLNSKHNSDNSSLKFIRLKQMGFVSTKGNRLKLSRLQKALKFKKKEFKFF
jgi:hypothetical protein